MNISKNAILLEFGEITMRIKDDSIVFDAVYERRNYSILKKKTFETLEEAFKWYEKVEKNMRGI